MSAFRKTWLVVAFASVAAGAVLFLRAPATLTFGQVVPSNFILRSEEELASLRAVFADARAWAELESLAERLALRRIVTVSERPEAGTPGAECSLRFRHAFDFSSPRSVSSRVYRAEYIRCVREDGRAEVSLASARFRSDFLPRSALLLSGRTPMRILKAAFEDSGVTRELIERFRDKGVGSCRVEYAGPGPVPGLSVYRFIASDSEGPEAVRLVYEVEYDEAEGTARFSPRS